ncbi:MAG: hypothetical protein ACRCTQ_05700 [Brevinemataceae bacterium]
MILFFNQWDQTIKNIRNFENFIQKNLINSNIIEKNISTKTIERINFLTKKNNIYSIVIQGFNNVNKNINAFKELLSPLTIILKNVNSKITETGGISKNLDNIRRLIISTFTFIPSYFDNINNSSYFLNKNIYSNNILQSKSLTTSTFNTWKNIYQNTPQNSTSTNTFLSHFNNFYFENISSPLNHYSNITFTPVLSNSIQSIYKNTTPTQTSPHTQHKVTRKAGVFEPKSDITLINDINELLKSIKSKTIKYL